MSSTVPASSQQSPAPKPQDRTPAWARLFLPAHRWLYRHTGGLIGHRLGPQRTLLLTTTGRKSGQPRTTPITYFRSPDSELFLVASNWGSDNPPAWYLNVQANPRVRVQLRRDVFEAAARVATPEERARLWPWLVARSPNFARYQQVAAREIPLVLLTSVP